MKKVLKEQYRSKEKTEAKLNTESIVTLKQLDEINSKLEKAKQNKTLHSNWISNRQKQF
jgi:hypothetical protein